MFLGLKKRLLEEHGLEKQAMGPADARRLKHIAAGAGMGALAGHIFGDDDKNALQGAVIGGAAGAGYSKNTEEALMKLLHTRAQLGQATAKATPGMWGTMAKATLGPAAALGLGGAVLGHELTPLHGAITGTAGAVVGAMPGVAAYKYGLMPGILGLRQSSHNQKINVLEELAEKGRSEYAKRGLLGAGAAGGAVTGAGMAAHGASELAEDAFGGGDSHEAGDMPEQSGSGDRHNQAIEGLLAKMSAYNS